MQLKFKLISGVILIQIITAALVFVITRAYYIGKETTTDREVDTKPNIDFENMATPDLMRSLQQIPDSSQSNDPAEIDRQANQYFENKNYGKAAELYRRVLELSPNHVETLNNLGLTLHYLGRSSEALEVLKLGSSLQPEFQRIWLTLGFVESGVGNVPEAREALERAIELGPETAPGISASEILNKLPEN